MTVTEVFAKSVKVTVLGSKVTSPEDQGCDINAWVEGYLELWEDCLTPGCNYRAHF